MTGDGTGELRRFLLGGTAWAGLGLAVAVVLAFVVNAVAARMLSEADLGAFLLMVSIAQAVSVWTEAGQPGLIAREVAGRLTGDEDAAARYINRAIVLVAGLTGIVTIIAAVAGPAVARLVFSDPAITSVFGLLGVLVIARSAERTLGDVFRAQHDIRLATLFGTVWAQAAATIVLLVLLVRYGTVAGRTAVLAYGLAAATVVPAALLVIHRRIPPVGIPLSGYRQHLTEGWPLVGHRALAMVLQQAPLWIVAAVIGAADAAPFGLALRVVTTVAIPLTVVNQVVPPIVARLHHEQRLQTLERAVRATATIAAAGAVVVVAIFVVFGERIIEAAFGAQYVAEATPLLIILSVGQLGAVWAGSCATVLLQVGRQRALMRITGLSMVAVLIGATVAAQLGGTNAVAAVAAAGVIIQNAATVIAVRRRVGIRTDVSIAALLREVRDHRRRTYEQDAGNSEE